MPFKKDGNLVKERDPHFHEDSVDAKSFTGGAEQAARPIGFGNKDLLYMYIFITDGLQDNVG